MSLTEMCISGKMGAKVQIPKNRSNPFEYLFGEDQSRYLIEVSKKNIDKVTKILEENSIYFEIIGNTQKDNLDVNKYFSEKISDLDEINSTWFENYYDESKK